MTPNAIPDSTALLTSSVRVPQHVVYRSFPTETVVLNLETGKYHGLNATAGKMLETLAQATSVGDAVASVAASYEQPEEVVERDIQELCSVLLERGLIEIDGGLH
jgi:Coenzyme PQQ synthesis protein D (PqqD)